MSGFQYQGQDLVTSLFITESDLIDQYVGSQLWSWGANNLGQLGDSTTVAKSSPVQTVAGGTAWKTVSAGGYHVVGLKTDGTLWSWGRNYYGQIGTGTTSAIVSSPVQTVAGGTNWKQVYPGTQTTHAIKTDGTLWNWGNNSNGQLGTGSAGSFFASPVQTVAGGSTWKYVAGGVLSAHAIKTDGTLWSWGYNALGQLGDNTATQNPSPIQTVAGGTNWKTLAAGYYYVAAIKTDGTLWMWGKNNWGQMGNNTASATGTSSPVQTVAGGTNWKSVAGGWYHIQALKTDGTLWGWGYNGNGELGVNDITARSSPVQNVTADNKWKQISAGGYHSFGVKIDGTLWGWGFNNNGQLGTNSLSKFSSPVQTVAGGSVWKQVSCSVYSTSAVLFT